MGSSKNSVAISNYAYTLGLAGNRTSVAELSGRSVAYAYDSLYRLTSETVTSDPAGKNGAISYTYDSVGNRKTLNATLPPAGAMNYSYDADDRLGSDIYDANGNTTNSGGTASGYDFENHLASHGAVSLLYDGDGNRVSETVGTVTTNYLVDTVNPTGYAQVVDELQGGNVTRTYSYGLERISETQTISGTLTTSFYGYDGHGSVRQLSNSSGAVTDSYDYDAFGNLINQTGSTPNNYLFGGEQFDPALSLYYNRARYLNTTTGRFVTLDGDINGNIGDPLSLHLYLYDDGDPVNRADPTGNQASIAEVSFEAALVITLALATIAVLANIQARIEIPFRANHYTQWAFVPSILASGLNRPVNYVTTDWYLTGKMAKEKLALSKEPQVLINFFVFKNGDDLTGPNPVEPANGEPGGGTEYYSDFPIPVITRAPTVLPLF